MSIFRFKQFDIEQSDTVFKVGTDAILCGCLGHVTHAQNILEIGTGTGIIALMSAQKNPKAKIIALEPHEDAFLLAKKNIEKSPFSNQIEVLNTPLQNYNNPQKLDIIISNPPYFKKEDLPSEKLSHARNQIHLSFDEIFIFASQYLTPNGSLQLIFPFEYLEENIKRAEKYLIFPKRIVQIQGNPNSKISRIFVDFTKEKTEPKVENLTIEYERGNFTETYKKLTQDYHPMF